MDGDINVESSMGKGSRFILSLPLKPPAKINHKKLSTGKTLPDFLQ